MPPTVSLDGAGDGTQASGVPEEAKAAYSLPVGTPRDWLGGATVPEASMASAAARTSMPPTISHFTVGAVPAGSRPEGP